MFCNWFLAKATKQRIGLVCQSLCRNHQTNMSELLRTGFNRFFDSGHSQLYHNPKRMKFACLQLKNHLAIFCSIACCSCLHTSSNLVIVVSSQLFLSVISDHESELVCVRHLGASSARCGFSVVQRSRFKLRGK